MVKRSAYGITALDTRLRGYDEAGRKTHLEIGTVILAIPDFWRHTA